MTRESASERGVADAWGWWLSQHPVSVPEVIKAAIAKAFKDWLDREGEEIVTAATQEAHVGAHDRIGQLCVEIFQLRAENEALRAQLGQKENE